MRLIDADAIPWTVPWTVDGTGMIPITGKDEIDEMPTIDATPVVRCKDCKWFAYSAPYRETPVLMMNLVCYKWGRGCRTDPDGFCFMGERKDG